LLQRINHGNTNRIAIFSLVLFTIYVVRLYGIPQPRVTQITQQLVLGTFENKKFENCFLATQMD